MKPVWIDFKQDVPPGVRALRIAMLIVGAAALAYCLMRQQQVGSEKTALAWQTQSLARLESRRLPLLRASQNTAADQDASKRANEVLRQLNRPWDQLFHALEQAMVPGISILSIAPDPHKATITLKAIAPSSDAAIDFLERLQAGRLLTGAHLLNQEILVDKKQHPVQFTITAGWGASS